MGCMSSKTCCGVATSDPPRTRSSKLKPSPTSTPNGKYAVTTAAVVERSIRTSSSSSASPSSSVRGSRIQPAWHADPTVPSSAPPGSRLAVPSSGASASVSNTPRSSTSSNRSPRHSKLTPLNDPSLQTHNSPSPQRRRRSSSSSSPSRPTTPGSRSKALRAARAEKENAAARRYLQELVDAERNLAFPSSSTDVPSSPRSDADAAEELYARQLQLQITILQAQERQKMAERVAREREAEAYYGIADVEEEGGEQSAHNSPIVSSSSTTATTTAASTVSPLSPSSRRVPPSSSPALKTFFRTDLARQAAEENAKGMLGVLERMQQRRGDEMGGRRHGRTVSSPVNHLLPASAVPPPSSTAHPSMLLLGLGFGLGLGAQPKRRIFDFGGPVRSPMLDVVGGEGGGHRRSSLNTGHHSFSQNEAPPEVDEQEEGTSIGTPGSDPLTAHAPPCAPTFATLLPPPVIPLARSSSLTAPSVSSDPNDVSILLVDEDESTCGIHASLAHALHELGYNLTICFHAGEAMSVLQHFARIRDEEIERMEEGAQQGAADPTEEVVDRIEEQEAANASSTTTTLSTTTTTATTTSSTSPPSISDVVSSLIVTDFQLIILDANAYTSSGTHMLEWLSTFQSTRETPVVIATTDGSSQATERWLSRGASDVLQKPAQRHLLGNTVFNILEERHQRKTMERARAKGDELKEMVVAQQQRKQRGGGLDTLKVSPAVSASPSSSDSVSARPLPLNVLLFDPQAPSLATTLLSHLADEFLVNVVPCTTGEDVMSMIEASSKVGVGIVGRRGESGMKESRLSNVLVGTAGLELLLLNDQLLSAPQNARLLQHLAQHPSTASNPSSTHNITSPAPSFSSVSSSLPTPTSLIPIILLSHDVAGPDYALAHDLKHQLINVMEKPLTRSGVCRKVGVFLRAVVQHRRRWMLHARANAYHKLLMGMRARESGRSASAMAIGGSSDGSSVGSPFLLPSSPDIDLYRQISLTRAPYDPRASYSALHSHSRLSSPDLPDSTISPPVPLPPSYSAPRGPSSRAIVSAAAVTLFQAAMDDSSAGGEEDDEIVQHVSRPLSSLDATSASTTTPHRHTPDSEMHVDFPPDLIHSSRPSLSIVPTDVQVAGGVEVQLLPEAPHPFRIPSSTRCEETDESGGVTSSASTSCAPTSSPVSDTFPAQPLLSPPSVASTTIQTSNRHSLESTSSSSLPHHMRHGSSTISESDSAPTSPAVTKVPIGERKSNWRHLDTTTTPTTK